MLLCTHVTGGEPMYPEAYINYLVHFHGDRDYFECHEVLEEYWKSVDKNNKHSEWVGLILLAVSSYHHRRNNFSGAKRTLQKSITILERKQKQLYKLGLDAEALITDLISRLEVISSGNPYSSYNLPIKDPMLISQCVNLCSNQGMTWCKSSNIANRDLIHRHTRRDRSSVVNERLAALQKKSKNET